MGRAEREVGGGKHVGGIRDKQSVGVVYGVVTDVMDVTSVMEDVTGHMCLYLVKGGRSEGITNEAAFGVCRASRWLPAIITYSTNTKTAATGREEEYVSTIPH